MITPERRREIFEDLMGKKCAGCGIVKLPGQSFCGRCYYSLPLEVRKRLWLKCGRGYEEEFEGALVKLAERGRK